MRFITKLTLAIAVILSAVAITAGTSSMAFATPTDEVCAGVNAVTGGADCKDGGEVGTTMKNIVNILSWVVGVISVIMIIIGGFQYVTSAGDSAKATKARGTITYAIVGLVIVVLAQVIVKFVLSKV